MIKDKNNGELVFVPSGGLGNRLRAVASAYHLSQTVGGDKASHLLVSGLGIACR